MVAWKICKIVLLVLAGLLAFALLLILLVLLGSVRYAVIAEASPEKPDEKKFGLEGSFSYLLPLFKERFVLEGKDFSATDYIFLIPLRKSLIDTFSGKKKKEGKEEKKKKGKSPAKAPDKASEETAPCEPMPEEGREPFFWTLEKKVSDVFGKISDIFGKISQGLAKVSDYEAALTVLFPYIRKVLQIILPKSFDVSVTFGMDDPAVTGQLLGLVCVLADAVCDGQKRVLRLSPDFEKSVLEADGSLRGHFSLIRLVGVAVAVALDKDARTVIKRI